VGGGVWVLLMSQRERARLVIEMEGNKKERTYLLRSHRHRLNHRP
jgi:hypothetical protein